MMAETMRERLGQIIANHYGDGLMIATDLACADAVLAALREPTEAMVESFGIHKHRMRRNWQAMIDAASQ